MRTHYELLSVEPTADADTIKKAFRREIARYHPDKVIHLGAEFQEMAATRAAELTVAYKTLSDSALRAEYDGHLADPGSPPVYQPPPAEAVAREAAEPIRETPDEPAPAAPAGRRMFETERAGRDVIVTRAITARVRGVVESLFGTVQLPTVRGFDTAIVPTAKPRFLGSHPPRVLIKVTETVDGAAVTEGWNAAARARVHAGKSPVVVLLFGRRLAARGELLKAMEAAGRQRPVADGPAETVIVAVATADWSYLMLDGASAPVRNLVGKICV